MKETQSWRAAHCLLPGVLRIPLNWLVAPFGAVLPSFLVLRHSSPILGSAQFQFLRDPQRFDIPSGGPRDPAVEPLCVLPKS